jgi:hypothetical protein
MSDKLKSLQKFIHEMVIWPIFPARPIHSVTT